MTKCVTKNVSLEWEPLKSSGLMVQLINSSSLGDPAHQRTPGSLAFTSVKYQVDHGPPSQLLAQHSTVLTGKTLYKDQRAVQRSGCSLTSRPRMHHDSHLLPLPLWHVAQALKQGKDPRRMSPWLPKSESLWCQDNGQEASLHPVFPKDPNRSSHRSRDVSCTAHLHPSRKNPTRLVIPSNYL